LAVGESERRFRHEAELLGRLRHPGIAQVFEAGVHVQQTPLGAARWPYFAMEYVEGARTLSEWAAAHRGLSLRELVATFVPVCLAVQHAHERGVLHRDLKPQNVLVGPDGETKVIDFGIARSIGLDDDEVSRAFTRTGELVGTLRYMSPEQVRGDKLAIDTRTDVHALGVVLFELLAGRLPFDVAGKNLPEVARVLCEVAPETLRHACPGADTDLELILATAMAKEPQRRYATAGALAEDLQRFLRREPINARAPSLGYQLRMFARRRRGLVLSLAALLLVSTIGGATSMVYAYRATRAENRATIEGEQKVGAMRAVFDMTMRRLLELPSMHEGAGGSTLLRRDVIEQAVQQLELVEQNAPLDHAMRRSLARAYCDLGGVQGLNQDGHVGDRKGAMASFEHGIEHIEKVLAEDPDDVRSLFLLADLELACGMVVFESSRDLAVAERHWNVAGATIERLASRSDVDRRQLDLLRVSHLSHLGNLNHYRGQFSRAVELFRQAYEVRKSCVVEGVIDTRSRRDLGSLLRSVAQVEEGQRHSQAAVDAYLEAYEVLREAEDDLEDVATRRLLASVRTHLGYELAAQGNYVTGEEHMRWAYLEFERLVARDVGNAWLETGLGTACQRLADHLSIQAKYAPDAAAARQLYSEARQIAQRGLEVGRPLRERSREMMTVFVVGECERILALCDEALR
ncbi:MAG: serine/threonine protein kinase, partial [Planctomycetes bacterium]|nr:serine/threonine protein kinase [Planctomycetota bacterium]